MSPESGTFAKPDRGQLVGATLFAIGLASTATQLAVASWFGVTGNLSIGWSTGGLVALVGSFYLPRRCDSWSDWKKKIWVWIGTVAVLALFTTYVAYSSPIPSLSPDVPKSAPTLPLALDDPTYTREELERSIESKVRSALLELDEDAFKATFGDALDSGKSTETITATMVDVYENEHFCVLLHWLDDTVRSRENGFAPGEADEIIVSNCVTWQMELTS